MNPPELPEGWSYEYGELAGQPHTRARHPAGRTTFWQPGIDAAAHETAAAIAVNLADAISAGLISARRAATDRPAQLDMFAGLAAPQLAGPADGMTSRRKHYNRGGPPRESQRAQHPTHGRFYQPHCWHCKRRRADRPHKRAAQS